MRRRLPVVLAVVAFCLGWFPVGIAAGEPSSRQVALFVVEGMSFEQFMEVPEFRSLARAGGASMMSPQTVPGDRGPGAVLTLGTGVRSSVPFGKVRISVSSDHTIQVLDFHRIIDANQDRSTPGLLGSVLESHGHTACADTGRVVLATVDMAGTTKASPVASRFGGSGRADCSLNAFTLLHAPPAVAGRYVRRIVQANYDSPIMVIVLEASPSEEMRRKKDQVTPLVIADGAPDELFSASGPMHTLTSDTTRRDGLVSNEDVAPTILEFFGIETPSDMNGAVIHGVDEGPPFDLHQRHLGQRRMTVPVQAVAGTAVTVFGLIGFFLISVRPRIPRAISRRAGMLVTMVPPLAAALLAAGGLPTLSYPWVVPFLVLVSVGAGALALRLRERGTLVPAATLGAAVLVFLLVEAIQGWPDTLTTLLGGTALDGARFYGLPNVDIGLLLGSAIWLVAVLRPPEGFGLLVAAAFFAGFPHLGANLGGALAILVAAGLWLPIRYRWRVWKTLLFAAVVVAAGMAIVFAAQVVWSVQPTHGTRFVQHAPGEGLSGLLDTFWSRLLVGWRILAENPFGWVPVVGLVLELWVVVRPPGLVAEGFARYPQWRDAMLVLVVSSMVAYLAADSGVAGAGLGFGLAAAGILYVPLMEETWTKART